ncbi:MAG: 4Fe-4S dicluster domain-containing protein [Desulfamplus sp.]|nr:4Fe-4S dicluster domain-containing protein [Desulfamplus sp.]
MKVIKIDKKEWTGGIDKSREKYILFGPVKDKDVNNREHYIFKQLSSGQFPEMQEGADTVLSPKSVIFPQSEKMLQASLDSSLPDHHIMKRVEADYSPRAVIGIRPFDAKALTLVNLNFDTKDYQDPYWCDAYKSTTFVGLAINRPSDVDFSTSMGSNPFGEEGLDLLLVDNGNEFLAKVITDKGQTFLDAAGFNNLADESAIKKIDELKSAAQNAIKAKVGTDNLKKLTVLDLYEAPFWDDIAFSCINCGTCTFVCPTCWCFDIQDETKGKSCTRFKNWDSCMFPLFTLHGSGHNPRGLKTQRVRQRFMHKLKYFVDKYDKGTMCVGCGRCVQSCPVNIDIREVCNIMNNYEPKK